MNTPILACTSMCGYKSFGQMSAFLWQIKTAGCLQYKAPILWCSSIHHPNVKMLKPGQPLKKRPSRLLFYIQPSGFMVGIFVTNLR